MASNWRFAILPAPWRINLLRDPASGVQAALTTFGFTQPADMDILYSLGGIFDAAIFIFYRDAEPITMFAQLRGKRVGMGGCRRIENPAWVTFFHVESCVFGVLLEVQGL